MTPTPEELEWRDNAAAYRDNPIQVVATLAKQLGQCLDERDALKARLLELEQRLARVAELAHDRDDDTHEWRSRRLGQCAGISWDHMEEAFSKDPLKRKSTLKWARLAEQVGLLEVERDALPAEVARLEADCRTLAGTVLAKTAEVAALRGTRGWIWCADRKVTEALEAVKFLGMAATCDQCDPETAHRVGLALDEVHSTLEALADFEARGTAKASALVEAERAVVETGLRWYENSTDYVATAEHADACRELALLRIAGEKQ